MSWQDDAKAIPIWPGALIVSEVGNVYRVVRVRPDDGWLYLASDDWGNTLSYYNPAGCYVDLRDPDTFRGAVARLALQLGAPEEAVREGVVLSRVEDEIGYCVWCLCAGAGAEDGAAWAAWCTSEAADPIETLAAWWASTQAPASTQESV